LVLIKGGPESTKLGTLVNKVKPIISQIASENALDKSENGFDSG
jgi:hypothetical protein